MRKREVATAGQLYLIADITLSGGNYLRKELIQSLVSIYTKNTVFQKVKLNRGANEFNVRFYCNDGIFYYAYYQFTSNTNIQMMF